MHSNILAKTQQPAMKHTATCCNRMPRQCTCLPGRWSCLVAYHLPAWHCLVLRYPRITSKFKCRSTRTIFFNPSFYDAKDAIQIRIAFSSNFQLGIPAWHHLVPPNPLRHDTGPMIGPVSYFNREFFLVMYG